MTAVYQGDSSYFICNLICNLPFIVQNSNNNIVTQCVVDLLYAAQCNYDFNFNMR